MLEVTIHGVGVGDCTLSGRTGVEGMQISVRDGTVNNAFLSNKAFLQIIKMKLGKNAKASTMTTATLPSASVSPTTK